MNTICETFTILYAAGILAALTFAGYLAIKEVLR